MEISGRIAWEITSEEGQSHYFDHLKYWRVCYANENPVIVPTRQEAAEYKKLILNPNQKRDVAGQFSLYEERYDWRAKKFQKDGNIGLQSPTGEQLLPPLFADVFDQFPAINNLPKFIPVSNGDAWALVSINEKPVLMTEFRYQRIIPERWTMRGLYFVQDKVTGKWGVLKNYYPHLSRDRRRHRLDSDGRIAGIKEFMPTTADEILEAELYTDCAPITFWISRRADKIGIITSYEATEIVYDSFVCNDEDLQISLFRDGRLEEQIRSF